MPRHDISLSGELDPPLYLYGLHVQPTDASTQCDVFRRAGSTTLLVQLRSDAMYCRPASWALLFACFDSMCNQRMLQREASSSGKQDLTHYVSSYAPTPCIAFRRAGPSPLLVSTSCATNVCPNATYRLPASWTLPFARLDFMCNQRMPQRNVSPSGELDPPLCSSRLHVQPTYALTQRIAFRRAGPSPLLVSTSCATNVCPNATYRLPESWTLPFARLDFMCNQRMPQRNVSPSGELDPPLCSSRLHMPQCSISSSGE
uniref:Uncharacterized protein n=1 Tax=Psilocybe cubensis TaxID=181762 RepID=A0A8H7Y4E9_PSICU